MFGQFVLSEHFNNYLSFSSTVFQREGTRILQYTIVSTLFIFMGLFQNVSLCVYDGLYSDFDGLYAGHQLDSFVQKPTKDSILL